MDWTITLPRGRWCVLRTDHGYTRFWFVGKIHMWRIWLTWPHKQSVPFFKHLNMDPKKRVWS